MLHGHTVDVIGKPKCQVGHVQDLIGTAFTDLEYPGALLAEHPADEIPREPVVSCRHRRMGCEDALALHRFHVLFGSTTQIALAQLAFEQGQNQKGGVAFVHVISFDVRVSEGTQNFGSSHPEDYFLAQSVLQIAAVQGIGQRLIPGAVLG